jgi:DNA modification methylase
MSSTSYSRHSGSLDCKTSNKNEGTPPAVNAVGGLSLPNPNRAVARYVAPLLLRLYDLSTEPDTAYEAFLAAKTPVDQPIGLLGELTISEQLYEFQRDIVRWSLRRGRAAIFADCGLGKTPIQLEWAQHVPGRVLILTPLAVAPQTVAEGKKFGIPCLYARSQADSGDAKIVVTNYDMIQHFDPIQFAGVVLDESSILKNFEGRTRTAIIDAFRDTPYRLAATATPAPNDYMELGNHAEFLGVMTRTEMLATFFVHDGGETQKWRLKGHAEEAFWRWICSWAVNIRKPSDIGYDDTGYDLPPLSVVPVPVPTVPEGETAVLAQTLTERLTARRETVTARVAACAKLVNASNDIWIVWCHRNDESSQLAAAIPGSVEVRGSMTAAQKEAAVLGFTIGLTRVLITKPSICGFGMNWQHCNNMAFVGLSDSWEQYYQAVRRCWRFGQESPVTVHMIYADVEGAVVENINRKDAEARKMAEQMVAEMSELSAAAVGQTREEAPYARDVVAKDNFTMHLGDCVEVTRELPDESVDYSIFSPPFASLYTYSNSERDMGNARTGDEFFTHFGYLVKDLYRVLKAGRLVSFHCMDLPMTKTRDGVIGLRDFRGDLIRLFQSHGFVLHSQATIWKDPVTAMQRTKALGLLHKTIRTDSSRSRMGVPDYLVTMRKPGDNVEPIAHTREQFPVPLWQRYASPVWFDIRAGDTLQYRSVRQEQDEKHICPLQLDVIRRGVTLWSNPGDVVFSPFAGIGSEGVIAIEKGRRFLGIELKEAYWKQSVANLEIATPLPVTETLPYDGEDDAPTMNDLLKAYKASLTVEGAGVAA